LEAADRGEEDEQEGGGASGQADENRGSQSDRVSQEGLRIRPALPAVLERAWGLFHHARGQLSDPDAVVLSWCRERRATPLAYDRAIVRRSRS